MRDTYPHLAEKTIDYYGVEGVAGCLLDNIEELSNEAKKRQINLSESSVVRLAIAMEEIEIRRETMEILKRGMVVSEDDSYPSGLEAIAIQLGMKPQTKH